MKRGDLVRIGKRGKVYRISAVHANARRRGHVNRQPLYELDVVMIDHPDRAKRVPDAFRWYAADELVAVPRG